ncbi:PAS domain S-box protein [Candidatus Nitronereus thalassa]|uniref:histidine kinase n=1 Tax=Candidatus Nitronereus thalassa TaxID=3020898 RepID=A0ABU3K7A2_9BACT|nr:PAS domain S-box protein [Candidatus Nitronereus thalassa]MDT7042245.1 PAS domain S-box protein [Candidatus Nitronereus thalassa]
MDGNCAQESVNQAGNVTNPREEIPLHDEQNLTDSIIENLPNMVFLKDAKDLRFVRINQAGESLLGYDREDLIGKNDYDFFPEEEADFFTAKDRAVLQDGTLLDIPEEKIHTRRKGIRILHTKKIPLYDQQGRPQYLLGISEDITSRKLAEQELMKSQRAYEDLVNSIDGIVWECEFPSYRFTFVSQQAERLLGYSITQWLNEPEFFATHLHPEDRDSALSYCLQETVAKRAHELEYRMIGEDGQVIWLRDFVTVVVEDDRPVKIRGVMVDVSEQKKAEKALEESRERFRATFENAGIGIVVVDSHGYVIESNGSLQTFLGYSSHELQNMSFMEFTHEEDLQINLGYFQELKAGMRDSYTMQKRYLRKDGHVVWGNLTVTPIRYAAGEFEYAIAIIEDITATKQSQEMVNKWATIFQHTQWGVAVSPGDSYHFELVNEAFARMHGYAIKELIGQPIAKVYALEWKEQLPKIIQEIHKRGSYSFECNHHRKDGSTFPALVTVSAITDLLGRVLYRVANVIDMSELKQAEKALRDSEERFRQFADNAEDVIWLTDWVNHQVLYVNPAYEKLWGCSAQALYQNPMEWVNLIHLEDRPKVVDSFMNILATGHFDQEYRIIRADGSIRWIRDRGFPIRDQQGNPYRIGGYAQDITDRKILEEANQRHNQKLEEEVKRRTERIKELEQRRMQVEKLAALGEIAAGVAHEINNPLASIGQSLEVLKRALPVTHPRYKYIGKIHDSVDRMAHIVRQLYQLYRPDSPSLEPVPIHEILQSAIEIMKDSAKRHGVSLLENIPNSLPFAKISRTSMTQVLCNIIQNALDVSHRNRVIHIGIEEHADSVVVLVSDQGPGISPEVAPRIFDPFFTTKEGTSTEGGLGLGLAVSHRLMESCGGSIDFSTELEYGTTFRITIPLHKAAS